MGFSASRAGADEGDLGVHLGVHAQASHPASAE